MLTNAYINGNIDITTAPTAANPGTATLTAVDANSASVTINLAIGALGTAGNGIYHMEGSSANTAFPYVDLYWPIGGKKATYIVSDNTIGTGNVAEVGEAFITQ